MKSSHSQRFVATVLSTLLVACSATRYTVPTGAEELSRFVLVLEEAPDGRVNHSWLPAEALDLERYRYRPYAEAEAGRIVLAASQQIDCYAQYLECYQQCRQTPVPPDYNQYIYDFGPRAGHDRYCSDKCMPQYTECLKAQGNRAQVFTTVDRAVDWLERNHESVLVGSMVVIAGVVFVTVSGGAGIVILAPLVVVTSFGIPVTSHIALASP
ncbi:hypothetical protein [Cystobacter fuscus]|uniref:hypothetical protein n=1 Tax=Cystobacter fuscus TaxID=43 RepID=UPI0006854F7D|nr:hypothetical protein [Cystobacter fuscus]